jgi:hypothetical protein
VSAAPCLASTRLVSALFAWSSNRDVVEGLPNALYPVTINGVTYHPQNEALLQWCQFQSPSTALGGAYSYANPTLSTQKLFCQ